MITVEDLTLAICRHLGATGAASFVEVGALPASRAVTIKQLPDKPDSAVAVTVYDLGEALHEGERLEAMVQLRFRAGGSRTAVDQFADDVAAHLHRKYRVDLAGIAVSRIRRVNFTPLGPDSNSRQERVDNYALVISPQNITE